MNIPHILLEPAVETARRVLREMDEDDVPAKLRTIAGKSGKLPPPLASKLIAELESSEWLRAEVVAAWDNIDPQASTANERVSSLFLLRPDGWEELVRAEIEADQAAAAAADTAGLVAALERSARELHVLRNRLAETEAEIADRVSAAVENQRAASERARQALKTAKAEANTLKSSLAEATARLRASEERNRGIEERLSDLQNRLDKQRRRVSRPSGEGGRWVWPPRRPLELAEALDQLIGVTSTQKSSGEPAGSHHNPTLPLGVRPDQAEAVVWLLEQAGAVTVIVDGWNVAYVLAGGEPDQNVRRRLLVGCAQLRRRAAGRLRPVVLFDSSLEHERFTTDGVDLRFVPYADAAAVDLVAAIDGMSVVISSDRAVRDRAEAVGAIALWSEALVDWIEGSR